MKGYKVFNPDWSCGQKDKNYFYQYEIGKTYEMGGEIKCCKNGFHACENPIDVFNYYPPSDGNRFCIVDQDGVISKNGDDSKVASSKIKIKAEIGIIGLVKAAVEYIFSKVDFTNNKEFNTGDQSAATNTGYRSAATVDGEQSIAIVTGLDSSASGKLGCWIVLTERNENYEILSVKAFKVDGKKVKPNTFYKLINGKLKEV